MSPLSSPSLFHTPPPHSTQTADLHLPSTSAMEDLLRELHADTLSSNCVEHSEHPITSPVHIHSGPVNDYLGTDDPVGQPVNVQGAVNSLQHGPHEFPSTLAVVAPQTTNASSPHVSSALLYENVQSNNGHTCKRLVSSLGDGMEPVRIETHESGSVEECAPDTDEEQTP